MSTKNKIYIVCAVWVAVCASMFLYFFKIFDQSNALMVSNISEQKKTLAMLEAEQESYNLAQKDLKILAEKPLQPNDFFSRDVALVKQIETLENLGNQLKVNFNLSGLSGIAKNAPKAKTLGDIGTVPYSINLSGPFPRVVDFIETLENLDFITHLTTLSLNSGGENVSANLTAIFYLRKQ